MIKHPYYKRGSLYLSGGMQHATGLGAGWRQECSEKLKQMKYYPIDIAALDIEYAKANGDLYSFTNDDEILQRKSNIRKHFIETDINLIRFDSDAVIVRYDESVRLGAGTFGEIHEAYMLDIPVFLVNEYQTLSEVPGWMQAETTKIFNTWPELYSYLEALPFGIIKRDMYGNRRSGTHYLCSLCGTVEEKHKTHFVSKISPLYCKHCVELVKNTFETHKDRYEFFVECFDKQSADELFIAAKQLYQE